MRAQAQRAHGVPRNRDRERDLDATARSEIGVRLDRGGPQHDVVVRLLLVVLEAAPSLGHALEGDLDAGLWHGLEGGLDATGKPRPELGDHLEDDDRVAGRARAHHASAPPVVAERPGRAGRLEAPLDERGLRVGRIGG